MERLLNGAAAVYVHVWVRPIKEALLNLFGLTISVHWPVAMWT
jgi:hypothetical protein